MVKKILTAAAGILIGVMLVAPLAEAKVRKPRTPRVKHCAPYICPNGKKFPTCTEKGYPINYFVNPCMFNQ